MLSSSSSFKDIKFVRVDFSFDLTISENAVTTVTRKIYFTLLYSSPFTEPIICTQMCVPNTFYFTNSMYTIITKFKIDDDTFYTLNMHDDNPIDNVDDIGPPAGGAGGPAPPLPQQSQQSQQSQQTSNKHAMFEVDAFIIRYIIGKFSSVLPYHRRTYTYYIVRDIDDPKKDYAPTEYIANRTLTKNWLNKMCDSYKGKTFESCYDSMTEPKTLSELTCSMTGKPLYSSSTTSATIKQLLDYYICVVNCFSTTSYVILVSEDNCSDVRQCGNVTTMLHMSKSHDYSGSDSASINKQFDEYVETLKVLMDSFINKPTAFDALLIEQIYSQIIHAFYNSPQVVKYLFNCTAIIRHKFIGAYCRNSHVFDKLMVLFPVLCSIDNRINQKESMYMLLIHRFAVYSRESKSKDYVKYFRTLLSNTTIMTYTPLTHLYLLSIIGQPIDDQIISILSFKEMITKAVDSTNRNLRVGDELTEDEQVFVRVFADSLDMNDKFCPNYDKDVSTWDKTHDISITSVMKDARWHSITNGCHPKFHRLYNHAYVTNILLNNDKRYSVVRCKNCSGYGKNYFEIPSNPKACKKMLGNIYVVNDDIVQLIDYSVDTTKFYQTSSYYQTDVRFTHLITKDAYKQEFQNKQTISNKIKNLKNRMRFCKDDAKAHKISRELENLIMKRDSFITRDLFYDDCKYWMTNVVCRRLIDNTEVILPQKALMCNHPVASKYPMCHIRQHTWSKTDGDLNMKVLTQMSNLTNIVQIQSWYKMHNKRSKYITRRSVHRISKFWCNHKPTKLDYLNYVRRTPYMSNNVLGFLMLTKVTKVTKK